MRRRLGFLSTLAALVLVLALPGATLAASYTYTVTKNTCTASGGTYGYGVVHFTVKLTEYSNSANKFTFAGKGQRRSLGGSHWTTDYNFGTFTWHFNANSINNSYTRYFDFWPGDFAWHRIQVTLKVWHNGTLLAQKTIHGKEC
jgi:hypothetical protein